MLQKILRFTFLIGIVAVITLSVLPSDAVPDIRTSDKLGHLAAYAALACVGGYSFRGPRSILALILGLLLLGGGLEIVQAFIPGRTTSSADMLANVAGIAIGLGAAISGISLLNKRSRIFG